jgi:hypothetical protein
VLLAKKGIQTTSKRVLRLKNDILKGDIIVEPIFRKLNRLVASGYTNIKTKENLRALLMDTTELRMQIDFGNFELTFQINYNWTKNIDGSNKVVSYGQELKFKFLF